MTADLQSGCLIHADLAYIPAPQCAASAPKKRMDFNSDRAVNLRSVQASGRSSAVRRNSKLASCWQRKVARRSALNNGYIRIEHVLARFGSNAPSSRPLRLVLQMPKRGHHGDHAEGRGARQEWSFVSGGQTAYAVQAKIA